MTHYYGVITNREYIKIQGARVPFWHFLDRQPDGWLCSLAYKRDEYPDTERPMLWDCGAWSYKDKAEPKIGKNLVTPLWALEQYRRYSRPGDFVVAPDHMLIPGTDLGYRRSFNRESAAEFLPIAQAAGFRPMAVVHGMDLEERLQHVRYLVDLGYDALALGGLAARAGQKRQVSEAVSRLRDTAPDVHLHVLGLSSPDYFRMWTEMGVQTCDGASHFRKAFTAGVFYTQEGASLKIHQAARLDKETSQVIGEIEAPWCDCTACVKLRDEGIDTRTYGSNENNMGRAAHNLNMLMRAQQAALVVPEGLF